MKISRSRNIGFDQARKTPAQMGWRFLLRYPSPPPSPGELPQATEKTRLQASSIRNAISGQQIQRTSIW